MKNNNPPFSFSSNEVNPISRTFINITELLTGKLKLKKIYYNYINENQPSVLVLNINLIKSR